MKEISNSEKINILKTCIQEQRFKIKRLDLVLTFLIIHPRDLNILRYDTMIDTIYQGMIVIESFNPCVREGAPIVLTNL